MGKKKERISPEKFNEIIGEVELDKIYLKSSSCDLKVTPEELDNSEFKGKVKESQVYNIENDYFSVFYTYNITLNKSGKPKEVVLEISCTFALDFSSQKTVEEDFLDVFASGIGHICAPYIREYFSSITSRMEIPTLFAPLFKTFPPKAESKETAKDSSDN